MAKDEEAPATGTAPAAAQPYRQRLGEAAGSLGRPLRDIHDEDVVVTAIAFEEGRKIKALADNPTTGVKRGELVEATAVVFTVESNDPQGSRYFSFSPSLVEKMRAVDVTQLPMDARFVQRPLEGGQTVWDVE